MSEGVVLQLRPSGEVMAAAAAALSAAKRHLERSKLSANTVKAYRRQIAAYAGWLGEHAGEHEDAFVDVHGAEAAATAWRRSLLERRVAPSTINQAIAAVTLLYAEAGLRIEVKKARIPKPGEPDALTRAEQSRVERSAARRGARDRAVVSTLLYAGARVEECARLEVSDVPLTARTGEVRLLGKGDQVRWVPLPAIARTHLGAWLDERGARLARNPSMAERWQAGRESGPVWLGQRGPLSVSGITQVVLAVGEDAGLPGLRPHQLRHTYATRLREGGADVAQIKELMGHASLDTTARYFRAGRAEVAAAVERVFEP
ncbi:tyrosine-type recombinase/integrase [Nonomuraea soli]|uniref:Integrase/recombinase XerC n=1 Tax=Nonomuraea soli TaxID=1032476 RepID=A0A7W0HW09_9ACTN|nr:tyrosine-type recombinase/integrase [Nonomuraea soli]MBA2897758.1 integrase/recombinase XerC [Nonomuraea soli]